MCITCETRVARSRKSLYKEIHDLQLVGQAKFTDEMEVEEIIGAGMDGEKHENTLMQRKSDN